MKFKNLPALEVKLLWEITLFFLKRDTFLRDWIFVRNQEQIKNKPNFKENIE